MARSILAIISFLLLASTAYAQEFLDTAGRWKALDLKQATSVVSQPRSIAAYRARVLIGRENRSLLYSRDSGETWRDAATTGTLPADLTSVWALAFPDTLTAPDRVIGIATFGSGASRTVSTIVTTDGGANWSVGTRLPQLDSLMRGGSDAILLSGRPFLRFVRDGSSIVGYIGSAKGLLVSNDGGASWSVRDTWVYRALAMQDARNGISSRALFEGAAGGIFATSDGGATWDSVLEFQSGTYRQWAAIQPFGGGKYRVMLPDKYQNFLEWRLLSISGGKDVWRDHRGYLTRRPLMGGIFWQDSTDIHVVSDGMIIQHSADEGEQFFLLRDTTKGQWVSDIDNIFLTHAPVSATDGQYIYIANVNNVAARWRMAPSEPFSRVAANKRLDVDVQLMLDRGEEKLYASIVSPRRRSLGVEIYDMNGVLRAERQGVGIDAGPNVLTLQIGQLSSGRYLLLLRGDGRASVFPIALVR